MLTGPQFDYWSGTSAHTGQAYSENTPMGIEASRNQIVRQFGAPIFDFLQKSIVHGRCAPLPFQPFGVAVEGPLQNGLLGKLLTVYPVYGRNTHGQFVTPGTYNDSVTIQVLY